LLTVIIGKLFPPAVDGFAFLGAQHLLTVGRPEGLAANLADLLRKVCSPFSAKHFFSFSASVFPASLSSVSVSS